MSAPEIAALITAAALLTGAVVALLKRRPEMTHVLVSSAGEVVIMQRDLLAASEQRIDRMEVRQTEQADTLRVSALKIEKLHAELAEMHEEMAALTESRDQAREDLESAKNEVDRLRARVQVLENTLRDRDIPLPDDVPPDGLS